MNWKKENKSYVDSNDFKDFEGMRLEQLNFINDFIKVGCYEEPTASSTQETFSVIQQHDLLHTYMIKPNMSMLYRNLKLFGNISIVSNPTTDSNTNKSTATTSIADEDDSNQLDDTMLCEDINDRIKVLIEGFYQSVNNGLTDFTKVDDTKIVQLSESLLKILQDVKVKYDDILD